MRHTHRYMLLLATMLFTIFAKAAVTIPSGSVALITSAAQMSSPYTEKTEGEFLGYLIDNIPETYWHSSWTDKSLLNEPHWIQVELNEPISGYVKFYMYRRLRSSYDVPIQFLIEGSTDGILFSDIATVELPFRGSTDEISEAFKIEEPVSYLRITATKTNGTSVFWHAAEMQLYLMPEYNDEPSDLAGVLINEIQVSNVDQFLDPSVNYGGWIELYNPGMTDLSLNKSQLRHTDADGVVDTYELNYEHGAIPFMGYTTLWFDHHSSDGNYGGSAHLNIPFKLDTEGGTIELLDVNGAVVNAVTYPPATACCSYARTKDGGEEWGICGTPTLTASNNKASFAVHRLTPPVVSTDSKIFTDFMEFRVEIPEGATLRFTTDGSTPTYQHGEISKTGYFSVEETTIYRFVLVGDGWLPSRVVTRSFIKDELGQYYLPVVSISTHNDNLFSDEIGLYVKGTHGISGNGQSSPCNWNMDWERPVNVEYLLPVDDDYVTAINQECEFKISGGWSRAYGGDENWVAKPSITLKAGKIYEGQNSFDYPIFGEAKPYNKYKTFKIRNGGNDTYNRLMDPGLHEIYRRSGFNINVQAWQPAHIFLNGRYLGMLNLRESNNKYFAESEYGIDTDDVDQFELNSERGYEQKTGSKDSFMRWLNLTKKIKQNPTSDAIWEQIAQVVDVDEFCNYMAAELYMGSGDWLTNSNNIKGFCNPKTDGKYHMVMFDLDSSLGSTSMIYSIQNLLYNNDGRYSDNNGVSYLAEIFFNMLAYEPFKKQFIDAFCIVGGSVMEPERCRAILNEMAQITSAALRMEGADPIAKANDMYNKIANSSNRSSRLYYLQQFFYLDSPYNIKLSSNVEEARLLIGGQEVPTRKFDGQLFAPIVLTAKAPAGYEFKGWQLNGSMVSEQQVLLDYKSKWAYYDQGSLDNISWKSNNYNAFDWQKSQAPFGFGTVGTTEDAGDYNTRLDYGGDPSNKRPTYYFRTNFELPAMPGADDKVVINYYVDDGAIFYVNGIEVGTKNCPSGATYNTYTSSYAGHAAISGSMEIPHNLLQEGTNLIAVEVHNTSASSTDIFFDANIVCSTTSQSTTLASASETFILSKDFRQGNYELVAVYEKLTDPQQLLEAGASPIRINEVSAGNEVFISDYYKKKDWLELYNATDEAIDIEGMYLSDNRANPQKYLISAEGSSASTIIPPHGHCIVWCDDSKPKSQLHTNFKLSNADGAYVTLQAADGSWADELTYVAHEYWETYGRYPDGGYHATLFDRASIGLPNVMNYYNFITAPSKDWVDANIAVTLPLQQGWNWISHNLSTAVDKSRFTTYANVIRGQQGQSVNDSLQGWVGEVNTLEAALGYKVQMNVPTMVTLRGTLFDVLIPVALQSGWNWLGCPLYNPTTLEVALANYQPSDGDAVVGIEGFATYEQGEWRGTLTVLSPGRSYLFNTAIAQDFAWNSLAPAIMTRSMRTYDAPVDEVVEAQSLDVDIHAYPDVTSVIASLTIDGERITSGNYVVAAFVGDECRGVAVPMDGLYYLNIHGEGNQRVTFRLIDAAGETYDIKESLNFSAQQVVGTRQQPFALSMSTTGIERPTVLGATPVAEAFYDLNGRRIAAPTSGICIQRTTYDNGKVVVKKIVMP